MKTQTAKAGYTDGTGWVNAFCSQSNFLTYKNKRTLNGAHHAGLPWQA